jgi:signal peptidase I
MIKNFFSKEELKDAIMQIIMAILIAVTFRSFFYEPYKIPSSSMKPTLIIGDCVFVSKFSYGFNRASLPFSMPLLPEKRIFAMHKPARGDVVVFRGPRDTNTYIKRLIGFPGDEIQIINGLVYINGVEVDRKAHGSFYDEDENRHIRKYIETLPNHKSYEVLDRANSELDNTEIFVVPDKHYFFLGDNRDQSQDSRVLNGSIGYVDEKYLVGRAEMIFFSANSSILMLWNFFRDINFKRMFMFLHPITRN